MDVLGILGQLANSTKCTFCVFVDAGEQVVGYLKLWYKRNLSSPLI